MGVRQMSMKFISKSVLLGSMMSVLALSTSALSQEIGVNAVVRNEVTLTSDGEEAREAMPSEGVFLGDTVRSGEDSILQVLLNDETTFTVGENAEMEIDEFVYDPSTASGSVVASVRKGAFRFMSGKIAAANPEQVRINAPSAYIGVRGTMLDLVVGEEAVSIARDSGIDVAGAGDGAALVILRGPGRTQSGFNKDGGAYINSGGDEVTLWKSGTAAFVPQEGARILGPFRLRDGLIVAFSTNADIGAETFRPVRPPRPPQGISDITRDLPDFPDLTRPPPPGGPGGNCPGECPNNQEEGFSQDTGF